VKVEPPAKENSGPNRHLFTVGSHSAKTPSTRDGTPEVLVPHDQEVLLAEYAVQWNARKYPVLLVQGFDATILSPLQMTPIQIDELDVKLLAEENEK